MAKLLSDIVVSQITKMYRWWIANKNNLVNASRRRGIGGGGGGIDIRRAFVKATPGATYDVDCYLDDDLVDWEASTNYIIGDRVTDSEVEYVSVQSSNLGNAVSDTDWWEVSDTSITVTVKTYSGGGFLNVCEPLLVDGVDFLVWYDTKEEIWKNITTFFEVDDCP